MNVKHYVIKVFCLYALKELSVRKVIRKYTGWCFHMLSKEKEVSRENYILSGDLYNSKTKWRSFPLHPARSYSLLSDDDMKSTTNVH